MEQLLTFYLGPERYGLEVDRVQEVLQDPPYNAIPRAPAVLLGAINVHGSPRTVLHLPRFLGFPQEETDSRIITLTPGSSSLAFAVSRLGDIVPLDTEQVLPRQEGSAENSCIRAVVQREDGMINLLHLDQLLVLVEQLCERQTGDA